MRRAPPWGETGKGAFQTEELTSAPESRRLRTASGLVDVGWVGRSQGGEGLTGDGTSSGEEFEFYSKCSEKPLKTLRGEATWSGVPFFRRDSLL